MKDKKIVERVKVDVITNTINKTCKKCGNKYSYKKPAGYRGRDQKCPTCGYQDMAK